MSFGSGIGQIIGAELGKDDLTKGLAGINDVSRGFQDRSDPYNIFGQGFLNPASGMIGQISKTAGADPNLNYNTFMQNYQLSPGAAYTISQADKAENNSASARGGLLSGANERALATTNSGIANTFANQAYSQYLQGNQQQFGQLESALGNMFQAIGVGTTATGQQAGVDIAQMGNIEKNSEAQGKTDQAKGSGIGSILGGISGLPFKF